MFVKNCWYVAAFDEEVSAQRPIARRILGEPIVLFRQPDGPVAALEDRCCHRGLPLSRGEMNGKFLRCNYHGLEFDASGTCVRIPGQDSIPPAARVRSYPLAQRGRALWIWMGNPQLADPAAIPAFPWFEDRDWGWKSKMFHIRCNYEMLHDNLLDLTHLAYVHSQTLGGNPDTHFNADTKTSRTDRGVRVSRWLRNSEPSPTYVKLGKFAGRVDRWQEFEFVPGLITLYGGAVDAGTITADDQRKGGVHMRLFDAITPETATTTLNFFCVGQNFRVGEPQVTQLLFSELERTVLEDVEVLEAQQARIQETRGKFVDIKADAAAIQARRIVSALRSQESSISQPE